MHPLPPKMQSCYLSALTFLVAPRGLCHQKYHPSCSPNALPAADHLFLSFQLMFAGAVNTTCDALTPG